MPKWTDLGAWLTGAAQTCLLSNDLMEGMSEAPLWDEESYFL